MKNRVDEFGRPPREDRMPQEEAPRYKEFLTRSEENRTAPDAFSFQKETLNEKQPTKENSKQKAKEKQRIKRLIGMMSLSAVTVLTVTFNYAPCPDCNGTGIYCEPDYTFGLDRWGYALGYAGCGGTGYTPCPDDYCHDGIRTCRQCEGTGIYHGRYGDHACPMCGGDGIDDCEFCHGIGTIVCMNTDGHVECFRCRGSGKIRVEEEPQLVEDRY